MCACNTPYRYIRTYDHDDDDDDGGGSGGGGGLKMWGKSEVRLSYYVLSRMGDGEQSIRQTRHRGGWGGLGMVRVIRDFFIFFPFFS